MSLLKFVPLIEPLNLRQCQILIIQKYILEVLLLLPT